MKAVQINPLAVAGLAAVVLLVLLMLSGGLRSTPPAPAARTGDQPPGVRAGRQAAAPPDAGAVSSTGFQTLHAASAKLGPPTDLGFPSMSKAFWFEPKFHPNLMAEHFYRRILIAAGYIEARKQDDPAVEFMFLGSGLSPWMWDKFVAGKHMINHSPFDYVIMANKTATYHQVRNFLTKYDCDPDEAQPPAYSLTIPEDCQRLAMDNDPDTIYFIKHNQGTFGNAISVKKLAGMREHFGFSDGVSPSTACSRLKKRSTSADYLVQRGWLKPLTMDGRKVDMRMYLMIANHDPYYVFTRFGEVRRSRLKFNPDDVSDPAMHITNVHYGVTSEEDKAKLAAGLSDRIFPFKHLLRYLRASGRTDAELTAFKRRLRELTLTIFQAFKPVLRRADGYWAVYSLDIVISHDLRLNFLEVNSNTGLHYDTAHYDWLVSDNFELVREMLSLVHEVHQRHDRKMTLEEVRRFETPSNFELIYTDAVSPAWSIRDGNCYKN